jgi:hypothetical protein
MPAKGYSVYRTMEHALCATYPLGARYLHAPRALLEVMVGGQPRAAAPGAAASDPVFFYQITPVKVVADPERYALMHADMFGDGYYLPAEAPPTYPWEECNPDDIDQLFATVRLQEEKMREEAEDSGAAAAESAMGRARAAAPTGPEASAADGPIPSHVFGAAAAFTEEEVGEHVVDVPPPPFVDGGDLTSHLWRKPADASVPLPGTDPQATDID